MLELNQNFLTGLLIGAAIGFIAHSFVSKSIRIVIIIGIVGLLIWLFYSNSLA